MMLATFNTSKSTLVAKTTEWLEIRLKDKLDSCLEHLHHGQFWLFTSVLYSIMPMWPAQSGKDDFQIPDQS